MGGAAKGTYRPISFAIRFTVENGIAPSPCCHQAGSSLYSPKKAGWTLGWVSAIDSERQRICIVDAHRGDGRRFVVHLSGKLTALESAIRTRQPLTASPGLMPFPVLFHPHIEVCKLLRKLLSKRFVFDPSGGRIQRFL
jgi:hypothetical protein